MTIQDFPHILVVDDDSRLRSLLRKYLMESDFRVTVADGAEAARQQMRGLEFDLIVMDLMMPGEDGISLTQSIRENNTVPIQMGDFRFDLEREILSDSEGSQRLTTMESALLKALATNPGQIMSRKILAEICGIDGVGRAIDVQVTRLRRKIEPDSRTPTYLQTIHGRGYVLRPD
jgi:two-component system phosphate regulon response regulator OmpR